MAELHPFSAILFQPETGSDVTPFVAPPYDVIDSTVEAELRDRHPRNVVRLTLPEASSGGDHYQEAARLFENWLQSGVLRLLEKPALYLWEQEFSLEDTTYIRRALVAKVACESYRPGGVMRHEHTHAGPKADRLKLFQATGAQFSQMFGIFEGDEELAARLAAAGNQEPLQTARGDDGHHSRLFGITDEETISALQSSLQGRTITIADGHHRYETSVAYYQELGRTGSTLMTLVPSSDAGLVVLPTHRTVSFPIDSQALCQALSGEFSVEAHPLENWPRLYQESAGNPESGIILAAAPAADRVFQIGWQEGNSSAARPGGPGRERGDVVVLHERILPHLIGVDRLDTATFGYFHDAEDAVEAAKATGQCAFLLRPTSIRALLDAAEHQEVLPAKSTYFYPKFLAGFINAWLD
ncbi:MAG: DUF1015 domain-containing protein [Fidelibacterota bacterium]|nr:MAG: DUF1015 domain-containing protein [Candidatus Neomarinimicrobiota bacterium]